MAKKQRKTRKTEFPKKRFALNALLSLAFGIMASAVETFVQNNVQTAAVMQGLANGNNSVAEYTKSLPRIAGAMMILLAALFFVKAVTVVIKFFAKKSED